MTIIQKGERMSDLISRQAAIDAVESMLRRKFGIGGDLAEITLAELPSAQPEHKGTRIFQEIIVEYPSICVYPDYRGKPYFSIKYTENGQEFIGYGTYKPEVLSEYLKEYFIPSAQPERWIPCSERLPEDIRPVIVTWKNTDPASYYQYIVGKHYTGTACYKNSKWYWYSSTTEDMLAEYGRYDSEEFDEAIECIAWMPLPEPYKERREE